MLVVMVELVKKQVLQEMTKQKISQGMLAKRTGLYRSSLSRLLSGKHKGVSEAWQTVLKALGLELIAIPKSKLDEVMEVLERQ